ncbi:hypothetical protein KKG83_06245 [Candidatus Micrarchaeota archaeon]|nr:hypothetical protein [Candidatus Micrarchaeota archaeon]MBU2477044.1 hypothetical protein [Candidatus Micrarchaeota archaeon]
MNQFLFLDAIAVIAGLIAIYFVVKTSKQFGKMIMPAFHVLITIIGLLIASITAKYFISDKEILVGLNNAIIISIPIAIAIGMYLVQKRVKPLEI